jgi:hypothetical protein
MNGERICEMKRIIPYYGSITECEEVPITFPPQHQDAQPGLEYMMNPLPIFDNPNYVGTGKLKNKIAIITGGDSGIGRAVAVAFAFAKEGADLVLVYMDREEQDARTTQEAVQKLGRSCLLCPIDLREKNAGASIVSRTLKTFDR